ncbi:pseudaminic acid synthase [Peptostreptococcaceae bacterium AGR-M142]
MEIRLKNNIISDDTMPYIIAEMSANHNHDIDLAKEIIHAAKESGADCLKLQTYKPETMTLNSNKDYFKIKRGTWKGENLYNLYEKAHMPWEWQEELKKECEKVGLDFLSTPFDRTSVDFLEGLDVEFYKIASFEITDIPLIKYIASKQKPIIMSTGMSTIEEIKEAIDAIESMNNKNYAILKCSSSYPSISKDMNLSCIPDLKSRFGKLVGLSDHTLGDLSAIVATSLGASIIEKHFCLSRDIITPDSSFSMEPKELKCMIDKIKDVKNALGEIKYGPTDNEKASLNFRRSIFITKDIKKGELFTENNIKIIRPSYGIEPKYYEDIIGKRASGDISKEEPLNWNMVEK